MDAADDSILKESGSAGEWFGSEAAEEISIVDDGDWELDDLPQVSRSSYSNGSMSVI